MFLLYYTGSLLIACKFILYFHIIFFYPSGGRDRRGCPILTFPSRTRPERLKTEDLKKLLLYLAMTPGYVFELFFKKFLFQL